MPFPQPDAPLRGEHAVLRLWEPEDAAWYVRGRDEEVFRWTREPRGLMVDQVRAAIEANRRDPQFGGFAIADASSGGLLGNLALTVPDPAARSAEVMYWLAPDARGRGIATDAVRTLTRWAFDALEIDAIELRTHPDNVRSQAVALRCGFVRTGMRGERLLFVLKRT